MAFDPRALGAQVQAANQAYRARSGGYSPFAPAQPQQTLATNQVQPRQTPANMTPPNYTPQMAPAGYTPGAGTGAMSAKRLFVGPGGVPMANPVSLPAFGQGTGAASFGQGSGINMNGSALTGGQPGGLPAGSYGQPGGGGSNISPNQNMTGPNAQASTPWPDSPWAQAQAAYRANQAPANPVATPTTSFTGGGDWARNFYGSAYGGSAGTGNGMAKMQGWAQNNPEAVQRMRNTGLVPPADYYTRNR